MVYERKYLGVPGRYWAKISNAMDSGVLYQKHCVFKNIFSVKFSTTVFFVPVYIAYAKYIEKREKLKWSRRRSVIYTFYQDCLSTLKWEKFLIFFIFLNKFSSLFCYSWNTSDKFHPPGRLKLRSHLFSASRTGFDSKLKTGKLFNIEFFQTMKTKQVFIPQFHDLSAFY